jgi:PAS domain S-box-containing protein
MDDWPILASEQGLAFAARLPGEMPRLVLAKDWPKTALGPVETWSPALKAAAETVLASGFPMAVRWGPQLISIYNDAYAALLGPKHPAALGAPIENVWPEIADDLGALNRAILRGERPAFFEKMHLWRVERAAGPEDARFTASYSPIPDPMAPNGIGGILVITLETTDEYRTDQQLRHLTHKLEDEVAQRTRERDRVWQLSEDLMAVTDFNGAIHSANPAWQRLLGWSEAELRQLNVEFLRHPDDAASAKVQRARLAAGQPQARMENRFRHKDGSWYWFNWTLATEGDLIYVIGRNISSDKEITQRARDSERDFRTLVGAVTDYAIFRLTPDGTVATWNAGAERAKGYLAHEIIGQNFRKFYTPEEQASGAPERVLARAAREGRSEVEGWRVRKDGSRFWANVVMDPIYDENGRLSGFAKITRDITERREAQLTLERTQGQLAQAQKMDALGQLTGGIAHDFNNMLMVVGGYTQFLKQRLNEPKDKRAIEAIEFATSRAESLTRQLLTFSRRQSLNRTTVKLSECFDAMRDILATTAKGNVALDISIGDDTWPVMIDVNEFEVAVINLVVNARDAMPKGGRIKITARNETIAEHDPGDLLLGDFVVIEVEDEGVGIAAEIMPKVFDPFFTTKGVEKGTGLGLSQVYGFAHQAGGSVRLTSKIDVGTKVILYLPRSRAVAMPMRDEQSARLIGGSETILLVEDNPDVRLIAGSMLEELGYTVRTADSAARALDVLKSDDKIALVLTDVVMPGPMDGMGLAQHLSKEHGSIKVLLTTGYSQAASDPRTPFAVLRKPYQLATMARAIRNALDQRPAQNHIQ